VYKHREQFYYQSATLLDAGLPITRSLETVAQGQKGGYRKAANHLLKRVKNGSQLNVAMAEKKKFYGDFDIKMVEAAEQSGNLAGTMKMLLQWYGYQVKIRRKLIGGMAFPILIFHLALFLGPLSGLFLGKITFQEHIHSRLTILACLWGGGFLLFLLAKYMPKRGIIRLVFDSFLQVIPFFGKALRSMAFARFSRSFNMLYKSGVPIITAAELSVNMTGNAVVSKLVSPCAKSVIAGQPMYKGFPVQLMPRDILASWQSGEESGNLDYATEHLAKAYEDMAEFNFEKFILPISIPPVRLVDGNNRL